MYSKGFTLTEVLVTLSIVTVIITAILLNQSAYVEAASLANLSDEIATRVVQAQVYGIAVRESTPGSSDFTGSYGVILSLLSGGSDKDYLAFVDRNSNEIYDGGFDCEAGGFSECLEKVPILRGNYISDLCVIRSSGGDQCNTAKRVDVSFLRPVTEARIKLFNSGGQEYNPSNMIGVRLILKSPSGLTRSVAIYQSGQVSSQ